MKLFQNTLVDIRDKIDPVLKTVMMKEEASKKEPQEKEKKHDESKTRWEKESSKEVKDEPIVVNSLENEQIKAEKS